MTQSSLLLTSNSLTSAPADGRFMWFNFILTTSGTNQNNQHFNDEDLRQASVFLNPVGQAIDYDHQEGFMPVVGEIRESIYVPATSSLPSLIRCRGVLFEYLFPTICEKVRLGAGKWAAVSMEAIPRPLRKIGNKEIIVNPLFVGAGLVRFPGNIHSQIEQFDDQIVRRPLAATGVPLGRAAQQIRILTAASEPNRKGTMLALYPPPELARVLSSSVRSGTAQTPAVMHCTLLYFGDEGLTPEQMGVLKSVAEKASRLYPPIEGLVAGVGRFSASASSDGKDVLVALIDSPNLTRLRNDLFNVCLAMGLPVVENHGYTPHITLSYLDPMAPSDLARIGPYPVTFEDLCVAVNDDRIKFGFRHTVAAHHEGVRLMTAKRRVS